MKGLAGIWHGKSSKIYKCFAIYDSLSSKICAAQPGFHAFTGCDYNPSFYGKGKNKPFKLLAENDKYQEAFADLADPEKFHAALDHIQDFVCKIYMTKSNGLKNIKTVDEARLQLFTGNYSMIDNMECFKRKILKFDACTLPPCCRELQQHLLRTSYIAHTWRNATLSIPSRLNLEEHGWIVAECTDFKWFEGPEMPDLVSDILIETVEKGMP